MLPLVGGKAASLGELIAAGLPVPDGFCLTTEAYKDATVTVRDGVLRELGNLQKALQGTANQGAELAAVAGRAREAIHGTQVPPHIAAAVEQAYSALGQETPVAVRSSATAEDLPFASFAGQQDTYLNIIGTNAVLDAVRNCWASLWTDRAVAYRAALGIAPHEVALAVVIQRMVDAEAAGVMFTANPLTGRRREAVIDAAPGLGEAVVSGAVNPDHFVVDMATNRILERKLGDKRVAFRTRPGGGTETRNVQGGADASSLNDGQALELAALGLQAERHFGAPQDTEWAIDTSGALWLTQSRPITTLYPVPESRSAAEGGARVYLCFSLAQGLTRPLTPMGLASLRLIGSSVARAAGFAVPDPRRGPSPYAEAGQRAYVDVTAPVRSTAGRRILPRVFDVMEARSAMVLRQVFEDPRFTVTRKTPFGLLRHVLPAAVHARVPETVLRGLLMPTAALRRVDRFTRQFADDLELEAGAGPLERLDHAERLLGSRLFGIVPAILPLPAVGFAALWAAGKLLGGPGRGEELQKVLRGLPRNVTTEMDLDLWHLASALKDDREAREALEAGGPPRLAADFHSGSLPPVLHAGLVRFLERYGHRAVAEIDVGMPRWSDDPTYILGVLANYLRLADPAMAPDEQFRRAAAEAETAVDRLAAEARRRGRVRGLLVGAALQRTRLFAGLRELPKYQLVLGLAEVRKQVALVGAELAAAGRLESADDVFFLEFDELRQAVGDANANGTGQHRNLRELVVERRAAYAGELSRRHIPRVLLSDGTEPEVLYAGRAGTANGALTGSPASAGSVTAPARVILDPVGAHLEPGEILVAPSTDPGWTPLFLTAGGLVMEMGGPNSHGAVVAREYGIPAVVGVPEATVRLTTGQQITVDGGAGTVLPG
ncbi:PEP/pyruvate-binding domain-containing protein [Arthrobacter sp. SLBN-100]|uniref:PEP/pyruvate-binding domain-containing protein n=1 Tax=Arthrobacter sp. SLBN-100 TaxID=2768450 RepID=UPI0011540E62|nr:PEP/pyruvate-binding domain-containing protein [Arthrobacter sp. SLBN-100]